ncbi:glycine--tRNA ligase subunit beta [Limnothrix redekei]|uniref:Glycine--tRNA ligase beta subunit n=1 Tax=Limnothrix redekei LRLZ20PSL1 TaxID=3112953 RepID=A0ABW7C6H4_9CYAN
MPAFLFEVGTEELPASFVASAVRQWRDRVPQSLAEANLSATSVQVFATPRRLALVIEGLPDRQPDRREAVKGPPASAAFRDGQPTKAAEGFARKNGVALSDLELRATDKGEFVFAEVFTAGRSTPDLLQELAPQWVLALEGKRFMRWGDGEFRFPRPIRSLIALWDDQVLPVSLTVRAATETRPAEVLTADRVTTGHRVLHPAPVSIAQATDYVASLAAASVLVNPEQRQALIIQQTQAAAAQLGGEAEIDPDLLEEVRDLVEFPTAVIGGFDQEFLELPSEVTKTVMVTHQRYFPVHQPGQPDRLLPNFITISNGDPAKATIIAEGNGRVVRARLSDGQYFYKADIAKPLESYLAKLETVTFQDQLGSMRAKVDRIVSMADRLCHQLQLSADDRDLVNWAALLCKADLVTSMVFEFPELQGIMGEKYARASGEPEAVAVAIGEHYLPKGAGDALPTSQTGRIVALADRLDTLCSLFRIGLLPSGSSDPFALRRAANAVVNIIWDAGWSLNLESLIEPESVDRWADSGMGTQLAEFFVQRFRSLLEDEQGIDYDLALAVVGEPGDRDASLRALYDPADVLQRAQFLQSLRRSGQLANLYATINRASKLAAKGDLNFSDLDPAASVKPALFEQPSEQAFYDALVALLPITQATRQTRHYQPLADQLAQAAAVVANFFDGSESVMVMVDDEAVRRNRLNLLGLLRNHARVLGDFGAIVKG